MRRIQPLLFLLRWMHEGADACSIYLLLKYELLEPFFRAQSPIFIRNSPMLKITAHGELRGLPQGVLAAHKGWPLFDTASTRLWERHWQHNLPPHSLMQRAGAAIARLALALAPHAQTIWIACGPGNNGGDGLQAAAWLQQHWDSSDKAGAAVVRRKVLVSCSRERDLMPDDAQAAWADAQLAGVQWVDSVPDDLSCHDLCIDALLGIGVRTQMPMGAEASGAAQTAVRPLDARLLQLHQSLQSTVCTLLCVDIASGLNADTGQYAPGFGLLPSRNPPRQRHCLALLTLHPGHFTALGRDACGQLWWDDLGTGLVRDLEISGVQADRCGSAPVALLNACASLPPCVLQPSAYLTAAKPLLRALQRPHASHKGSFGDVVVLGGQGLAVNGQSMAGAAWLGALAALHGGAGRTMLALLDLADSQGTAGLEAATYARTAAIAPWPEIMLRRPETQSWTDATVVCGCGGGQAIAPWLPQVLAQAQRLVLDADALNAIAVDAQLSQRLQSRAALGLGTVLTPHPLEAARLLQSSTAQVQADRLHAARQLARRFHCSVLLKGSGTVIVSDDLAGESGDMASAAPCYINPTGNALLAAGGTGDVLAGLIGALWSQGLNAGSAAALGAYLHGRAADEWPQGLAFSASALAQRTGLAMIAGFTRG